MLLMFQIKTSLSAEVGGVRAVGGVDDGAGLHLPLKQALSRRLMILAEWHLFF